MQKIGRFSNKACFKERRRKLRRESTEAEKELWYKLRNKQMLGHKFRRQYNIGYCIVDFYCHELKLVIEVDGYSHEDEDVYKHDLKRQKFLENSGFKIIRFTDEQVLKDMDNVINGLIFEITKLSPANDPTNLP